MRREKGEEVENRRKPERERRTRVKLRYFSIETVSLMLLMKTGLRWCCVGYIQKSNVSPPLKRRKPAQSMRHHLPPPFCTKMKE